ncbi:MAG: globin [Thiohalorhabdus sp.]|uniref:globin n=1 Tax=Thiohalorhabdus sp. TaxID=3094134 RepID=UPI003980FDE7
MADPNATAVKRSLGRCLLNGDVFGTFYNIFLDSDPRVRELFANTEWEAQKALLRQGVNNVISFYEGSATAQAAMDRIRQTHSKAQMNIPPDLYDFWVDSMVEAVRRHDPELDAELEAAWKEVLTHGVDYVRAGYDEGGEAEERRREG